MGTDGAITNLNDRLSQKGPLGWQHGYVLGVLAHLDGPGLPPSGQRGAAHARNLVRNRCLPGRPESHAFVQL